MICASFVTMRQCPCADACGCILVPPDPVLCRPVSGISATAVVSVLMNKTSLLVNRFNCDIIEHFGAWRNYCSTDVLTCIGATENPRRLGTSGLWRRHMNLPPPLLTD
jgi:hypothetical protein